MAERLCGPDCWCPNVPHREPETEWIGPCPILHGESDREVPGTRRFNSLYVEGPDTYCLCGHPNHLTCPGWYGGGPGTLADLEITLTGSHDDVA